MLEKLKLNQYSQYKMKTKWKNKGTLDITIEKISFSILD